MFSNGSLVHIPSLIIKMKEARPPVKFILHSEPELVLTASPLNIRDIRTKWKHHISLLGTKYVFNKRLLLFRAIFIELIQQNYLQNNCVI